MKCSARVELGSSVFSASAAETMLQMRMLVKGKGITATVKQNTARSTRVHKCVAEQHPCWCRAVAYLRHTIAPVAFDVWHIIP